MSRRLLLSTSLLMLVLASVPAHAQQAKKKTPPKKAPTIGTLGTSQMKGGDGLFGTTYTLANNGGYVYNVTLTGAEYTVTRFNADSGTSIAPKAGEKLLLLHFLVQNPAPGDMYLGGNFLTFATVAKDNQTRQHSDFLRLASAKEHMEATLKPGQKLPGEVLGVCVVPAAGPIPKLIVNMGRKGTSEQVTRYMLGTAPNLVKPLSAPDADPADPTGATARTEVSATIGTVYPAGYYDLRVDSIAFAPGPFGDKEAGDGKRFLVATVTMTNRTWNQNYFNSNIAATLTTADDEKATEFTTLKGKRDEAYEGRQIAPEESVTIRLLFAVPKDTTGKTLKLAEIMDNMGTQSRAFIYDLSTIK